MKPTPKRPKTQGRLGQLNKRTRLARRELGQWKPQDNTSSRFDRLIDWEAK